MTIDPAMKAAYDNLFTQVANQEELSGDFARKLPIGEHLVLLKEYQSKTTKTDKTTMLEAEFCVAKSTDPSLLPGTTCGEAWFIGKGGWPGKYATERAKKFIVAVQGSIGDPRPIPDTGGDLVAGNLMGVQLMVRVEQKFEDDGITPVRGSKGQDIYNSVFSPVKGQTPETVKASAAQIAVLEKAQASLLVAPAAAPMSATTPQGAAPGFGTQVTAAPAPAPSTGFSGFGGFGK